MTLILKPNLGTFKMYLHPKNEVPSLSSWDRQTDPTEIITYPHTWMVKILKYSLNVYIHVL